MPKRQIEQNMDLPLLLTKGNPNPILRAKKNGFLLYANPASRPLLKHWGCKVNEALPALVKKHITLAVKSRTPAVVEERYGKHIISFQIVPDEDSNCVNLFGQDVTKRDQAEENLRDLSSRQNAILASVPDIIMEVDNNKIYTWANLAGLTFFGEDVIGKEADFYFEGEQDTYNTVQPLFNGDENTFYLESWQRRKDGERRLLAWWCHVLKDMEGNVIGALSTARDITEQKQTEEGLIQTQEHYHNLIEQSADAIFISDLQGANIEVNHLALEMLGYTSDEFKKPSFHEISAEANQSKLIIERLLKKEQVAPYERMIRRKNGSLLPVEISISLILDRDGNPSHIQSIVRDITVRKQAEEALRENEQRLSSIYDTVGDIMFYLEVEKGDRYRFVSVNRAFLSTVGLTSADVVGKRVDEVIPEPSLSMVLEKYKESIRKKKIVHWEETSVYPVGTVTGDVSIAPVFDSNGHCTHLIGAVHDITERKRMEAERQALLEIMQGVIATDSLQELLHSIHRSLSNVIYAQNFFAVIYNKSTGLFEEAYSVDKFDATMPPSKLSKSITSYVFRTGKPILMNQAKFDELAAQGEIDLVGTNSPSWLGVPIKTPSETIGVIAIQNYEDADCYSERDLEFFASVGLQVSLAIERKQAEKKRQESEALFTTTFQASPAAIVITRISNNQVLDVNKAFLDLTGYSHEEVIGHTAVELNLWFDTLQRDKLVDMLKTQGRGHGDVQIRKKSGEVRDLLMSAEKIELAGEPYMLTMAQDITERKQMEEAVRVSEEKWRSLVQVTPDYIALHDRDGKYLFLNHYAEGFSEKDVIGRSLYEFLAPESKPLFKAAMEKCLSSGKIQKFELIGYGDLGTYRTYEEYLIPVNEEDGTNLMIVARDITERKEAEKEILRLNAELEQRVEDRTRELIDAQEKLVRQEKLAVLGQLAGGVGHELRNPLAVINNAIYFLKLIQPNAEAKVREYLSLIEKETHTAEKIISDLLDFARIKSVDKELVTVSTIVQRVLERYPTPEGVTTALKIPAALPKVLVDPGQMEQVVGNLVMNASQAMPGGGSLTISAVKKGGEVILAVKDTGVGISPENMSRLFEPLFTTKAKGIGLGLAVSRKLAEANGGKIEVQSVLGKGSTFMLYLPSSKETE